MNLGESKKVKGNILHVFNEIKFFFKHFSRFGDRIIFLIITNKKIF